MFYCLTLPLFVRDMAKNKDMTVCLEASGKKNIQLGGQKKFAIFKRILSCFNPAVG